MLRLPILWRGFVLARIRMDPMTTTANDEQQSQHLLYQLGKCRQALCAHKDARAGLGWTGASTERAKLARTASKVQQAVDAKGWRNPGPSLIQSVGGLMGCVEVLADAENKFVPEFAEVTLSKMEDVEQALRSRLDGSLLIFPITSSDLTRLAGLKNLQSVTKQIDLAINKYRRKRGKADHAKRERGQGATFQESELRQAYPYLREGSKVKEFIASALEIK